MVHTISRLDESDVKEVGRGPSLSIMETHIAQAFCFFFQLLYFFFKLIHYGRGNV